MVFYLLCHPFATKKNYQKKKCKQNLFVVFLEAKLHHIYECPLVRLAVRLKRYCLGFYSLSFYSLIFFRWSVVKATPGINVYYIYYKRIFFYFLTHACKDFVI